jgi:hypothetical protein
MPRLADLLDVRHPRYRSLIRRDRGPRAIAFLIGILVVTAAILFVVGRIDTMRRSGTAAVTVVRTRFQPRDPGLAQTPQGNLIEYLYVVDGVVYSGADFRLWTDVDAHQPKVCHEPADPTNHLLVDGRVRCGIDPGP